MAASEPVASLEREREMADTDGTTGRQGGDTGREGPDKAGVIVPPPAIAVAAVMAAAVLEHIWPSGGLHLFGFFARLVVGAAVVLAGLGLAFAGERRFTRAGTEALPWRPATALVTDGVYRTMRNPMYVGLLVALLGVAVALDSLWLLGLIVAAGLVLHYGVVLREERYLERKFGDDYRRFKAEVPRYGWPPPRRDGGTRD
jgi:protein-S-isoprenylcysteine O-methyltransferase Ste14